MWPDRSLLDLIGIEIPVIQAPMAGANGPTMAIAVSEAGGLGSLPCGMLDTAKACAEIGVIRQSTTKPLNVNFFCGCHALIAVGVSVSPTNWHVFHGTYSL